MTRCTKASKERGEPKRFEDLIEGVRPLESDRRDPFPERFARSRPSGPARTGRRGYEREAGSSTRPEYAMSPFVEPLGGGDVVAHTAPGIPRRVLRRLRRGQIAPRARLDLHGMTLAAALTSCNRFLSESATAELHCVCIIHGKGRGSTSDHAVLKSHVQRWLRDDERILAFCTAPPADGGTGATLAILRRGPRPPR